MNQLWDCIFPAINETMENFSCNIKEILKTTYDYFISWSGLQGEYSQVREKWIKDTMKAFCNIGIVQELEGNPDTYEIFYGKKIRKDVSEYFVEKRCKEALNDIKKKQIENEMEEAQRVLSEFD